MRMLSLSHGCLLCSNYIQDFFNDNLDLKLDHLVVVSEVTGIGIIIAGPVLT